MYTSAKQIEEFTSTNYYFIKKKKSTEAFSDEKTLSILSSFAEGQCCVSELQNTNKTQIIISFAV